MAQTAFLTGHGSWWRRSVAGCLLSLVCGLSATALQAADGAASAPPSHRSLRDHRPPGPPTPTEPQRFAGHAKAPAFTVVPRRQALALYPCSQCHKLLPVNPQPRKLVAAPHNAGLQHGQGRFWCLECHQAKDRDVLRSLEGTPIDFNDAAALCGQCHGARHRDWAFGGHGKRVAGWQGPRQIYACTHCHDPHNPTLAPREPSKPPPVRAGLQPMTLTHAAQPLPWQRTHPGAAHAAAQGSVQGTAQGTVQGTARDPRH